jgi:hypothetical protein
MPTRLWREIGLTLLTESNYDTQLITERPGDSGGPAIPGLPSWLSVSFARRRAWIKHNLAFS